MNIVVADDDADLSIEIVRFLRSQGHESTAVNDPRTLGEDLLTASDVLICDLSMPGKDGVALMQSVAHLAAAPAVIVISGHGEEVLHAAASSAENAGLKVAACLRKPFLLEDLSDALNFAVPASQREGQVAFADEQIAAALVRLIDARSLPVLFQPKVDVVTYRFCGAEALLPAILPGLGSVGPPAQLRAAQKVDGLVDRLTHYIVEEALRVQASWRALGHAGKVNVNIPSSVLLDEGFIDFLSCSGDRFGVARKDIVVELNEEEAGNIRNLLPVLTRLRIAGFGVSLDDFGQMESGLLQLARLPISELKLDRQLVAQAAKWSKAASILFSMTRMARELGIEVTAEGVETPAELAMLRRAQATCLQGFLIARKQEESVFLRGIDSWISTLKAAVE